MTTFEDLKDFFVDIDYSLVMAADAEPVVHKKSKDNITQEIPAGGVSVALDSLLKASKGIYIARGKTVEDKEVVNKNNEIAIHPGTPDEYLLKRLFFSDEEVDNYYYGFSNQTLWPLCHVAWQRPEFKESWFEGYKKVNMAYAKAILQKIQGKSFVWVNDYQLALVPKLLNKPKDTVIGLFWHIPWPTWEIFRILPQKKEILESLLCCDFIAFHRGYQVRNFLQTVERELEARIDRETNKIYYNNHVTTVRNLPMGIDVDTIIQTVKPETEDTFVTGIVKSLLGIQDEPVKKQKNDIDIFFKNQRVILGVDRLDYTKGLRLRLEAIDMFFDMHKDAIGKVSYMGILAPSREQIPAYKDLAKVVHDKAKEINKKYAKDDWKPIHLVSGVYSRLDILNLYRKASICLVTPLDDGMNLVSKEFIVAASLSDNPGMLVLSQFAGSAIDLTQSLIINPYNVREVAEAIHTGMQMSKNEKKERIMGMAKTLEERNVYSWAIAFIRRAINAATDTKIF